MHLMPPMCQSRDSLMIWSDPPPGPWTMWSTFYNLHPNLLSDSWKLSLLCDFSFSFQFYKAESWKWIDHMLHWPGAIRVCTRWYLVYMRWIQLMAIPLELTSIRYVIVSAVPNKPSIDAWVQRVFVRMCVVYCHTDDHHCVTYTPWRYVLNKAALFSTIKISGHIVWCDSGFVGLF